MFLFGQEVSTKDIFEQLVPGLSRNPEPRSRAAQPFLCQHSHSPEAVLCRCVRRTVRHHCKERDAQDMFRFSRAGREVLETEGL